MNVELYYEFIVLAEELNFHEAARRLCMTQSTLSKHLASLERHYGVRLFKRDRSHVQLTAKGSFLLECALAIWTEYERSIELVKNKPDNARGLFISGLLTTLPCFLSSPQFSTASSKRSIEAFRISSRALPPRLKNNPDCFERERPIAPFCTFRKTNWPSFLTLTASREHSSGASQWTPLSVPPIRLPHTRRCA